MVMRVTSSSNMEFSILFPQIVFHEKLEDFKDIQDNLIDVVYKIRENDPIGKIASNAGGWQSNDDSPELEFFLSHIVENFKVFSECVLENYWVNINPKGTFNRVHVHPGCDLAAVLWIKSPPNSGSLTFPNPYAYSHSPLIRKFPNHLRDKYKICTMVNYEPQDGECIIFPADMLHGVDPNQSDEDRISLSFNLMVN